MFDWRTIKKIDAHIHILPDAVHEANPDSDDVWAYADLHMYRTMMDGLGVEKAIIMPLNDPWLMSMEFTIDAVHKNLYEMKQCYPGKFYAFADVDTRNAPDESVDAIRKAIVEYGLDGIKIHPNNTGVDLDSEYNQPIFAFAQEQGIPVAIHSYPNSENDRSAAYRIINVLKKYPELTELTPAVLHDLVNKVYICAPDKSSGHRVQDVQISLACIGFLPESIISEMVNHAVKSRTA